MGAVLRPLEMTDAAFAALAALNQLCTPGHWHVAAELKEEAESCAANGQAYVAFGAWKGASLVGMCRLWDLLEYRNEGLRFLQLAVHPDHRGEGLARALSLRAIEALPDTRELLCEIPDYAPDSVAIAEAHGFVAGDVEVEQRCRVDGFSAARLAALQAGLAGLDVRSLAELSHLPDWRERLHALYVEIDSDVPAPVPYTPPAFDDFVRSHIGHPALLLDGCFIARDGDAWIAMSELRNSDDGTRQLHQDLTGVRRPWRRRGIAVGLKARGVAWAQANGFDAIHTFNSTDNPGMLAVNRALGYEVMTRWTAYLKRLR